MSNCNTNIFSKRRKMAIMKRVIEIQDKKKILAEVRSSQFVEDQSPPVLVTVAWIAVVFLIVFLVLFLAGGEGVLWQQ